MNEPIRRKRYQRSPAADDFTVSEMDFKVLELIQRYYYVRSKAIFQVLGYSPIYWGRKLRKMYDRGLVTKAYFYKNLNLCDVYKLDKKGIRALEAAGRYNPDLSKLHGLGQQGGITKEQSHTLMISDIMCSIIRGMQDSGCELIDTPDIFDLSTNKPLQMVGNKRPITPDNIFGIRYPDGTARFFALEADTGSFTYDRYIKKLEDYQDKYACKSYANIGVRPLPNLITLTVTANKARANVLRKRFKAKTTASHNPFLFSHIPVLNELAPSFDLAPRLFTEPWDRVEGLEPFYISK